MGLKTEKCWGKMSMKNKEERVRANQNLQTVK